MIESRMAYLVGVHNSLETKNPNNEVQLPVDSANQAPGRAILSQLIIKLEHDIFSLGRL